MIETDSPALFDVVQDTGPAGPILAAANATIAALQDHGALDATHSLKIELIRSGSRALDREMQARKVTVAAMTLFAKVVDVADGLPTIAQAVDDTFTALVKALEDSD